MHARIPKCPVEYVEWLKQTLYLGHDVARRKLKQAAERQKKGYQEKCRSVSFTRGDWVWKVDSVFRVGKLHEKNKGPVLVVSRTGPVNYEIQETDGGRKSILHVDKLYPYVPEDGEDLTSWLPQLHQLLDVSCQCDVSAHDTVSTACQVEILPLTGSNDFVLVPSDHESDKNDNFPPIGNERKSSGQHENDTACIQEGAQDLSAHENSNSEDLDPITPKLQTHDVSNRTQGDVFGTPQTQQIIAGKIQGHDEVIVPPKQVDYLDKQREHVLSV